MDCPSSYPDLDSTHQGELAMSRYVLTFGAISGALVVVVMSTVLSFIDPDRFQLAEVLGYITMIAVLCFIFIGIKRYRDIEKGGVIRFAEAFKIGALMSLVAGLVYAVGWEIYMFSTDYAFTAEYSASLIRAVEADNISAAQKTAQIAEIEHAVAIMANPLARFAISLLELLPVALAVSLISALILKNRKVLPVDLDA
jgi:hypothetical protein